MDQQVDVALKGCRSVSKTEWNNNLLLVAIPHTKRHFSLVPGCYLEPMIRLPDNHVCKGARASKAFCRLASQLQWKAIFLSNQLNPINSMHSHRVPSDLGTKKIGATASDLDVLI